METLDLNHPDYQIFKDFVTQNNLQNPVLQSDDEAAQMHLTFDKNDQHRSVIYHKALLHFDMSEADTFTALKDNRLTIVLEH